MRVLLAVTLASVAIGALGARADADAEATKLVGSVEANATISLEHENGTPVTTLGPGSYDIEVTDSTPDHNFHLTGPGAVDEETDVAGQGTVTWSLTLVEGYFHYVCDIHPISMAGHFSVIGSTPPPPPPPGPPPPGPPPPPGSPPPPAPPPPPPPPPIEHPPPLAPPAASISKLSVRVAPGRVVIVSVHAAAPTGASMELRRGTRRVQSKRASLRTGRNVLRMRIRPNVRAGRYLLVVRTTAGRALTHRLRLR